MKQNIWNNTFQTTSFLVNAQRKLSLTGLLSMIQEMAWSHAAHLGHGYESTRAAGDSWVVARQLIEVERWPRWGEEVQVSTWLRTPGAVVVTRDFEFSVEGKKFGQACAHWLTIDHVSRRPTRLPFPDDPSYFRHRGTLTCDPPKLPQEKGLVPLADFKVRYGDLDMNGHVNNLRFAQWLMDSLPLDTALSAMPVRYETNFLAEAKPGDEIKILGPTPSEEQKVSAFQGRRIEDEKLLFTSRLEMSEMNESRQSSERNQRP